MILKVVFEVLAISRSSKVFIASNHTFLKMYLKSGCINSQFGTETVVGLVVVGLVVVVGGGAA